MRGLAIAAVICLHAHLPGFGAGFIGVDVFFVLSGYLITGLLVGELSGVSGLRPVRHALLRFSARRAARLFPAMAVAVVLVAVVTPVLDLTRQHCGLLAVTYSMNLPLFGSSHCEGPWHVFWSLAAEEQFYLVWPLSLWLLLRHVHRAQWHRVVFALWLAAATTVFLASSFDVVDAGLLSYGPCGRSLNLLLGCALALWPAIGSRVAVRQGQVLTAAALLLLTLSLWLNACHSLGEAAIAILAGAAAGCLLAGLNLDDVLALWICRRAPLAWLGRYSYSLYLTHVVAMWLARRFVDGAVGVQAAVGILGAFTLAVPCHLLVEKPAQRRLNVLIDRQPSLARRSALEESPDQLYASRNQP